MTFKLWNVCRNILLFGYNQRSYRNYANSKPEYIWWKDQKKCFFAFFFSWKLPYEDLALWAFALQLRLHNFSLGYFLTDKRKGLNLHSIYLEKEGISSHVTYLWAPRGREQPKPAKAVLFYRNLLYSAVLIFVNNYCKNTYVKNGCKGQHPLVGEECGVAHLTDC